MVEVIERVKSSLIADLDMVTLSTWVDFKTIQGRVPEELSEEVAKLVQVSRFPSEQNLLKEEKKEAH